MKVTILFSSILLSSSLLLTGCWDRKEINDVAFVMGTAIDKEGNKFRTSIQIALPGQLGGAGSKGGGGGQSGGKSWLIESKIGESIRETNIEEQKESSRTLYFAHRRIILVGDELARAGIAPILDVLGRIPQNRLGAYLMVTNGPAQKLLSVDTLMEQFSSEKLREMAIQFMRTPPSVKYIVNILLSDGIDLALPTTSQTKVSMGGKAIDTVKVDGLAVFRGDKLAGFLQNDEASGLLWAMNEARNPTLIVSPPEGTGKIAVTIHQNQAAVKPVFNGNQITMKIEINAKASVVENSANYDLNANDNILQLEQVLNKQLQANIEKALRTVQKKYRSDPVGFGKAIYNQQPQEWKRLKADWDKLYPQVKVEVKPKIMIENTGSLLEPLGRKDRHIIE